MALEAFATFQLVDGRRLFVGPTISIEGMFPDGEVARADVQQLGLAIEPADHDTAALTDLVDADGFLLARRVSVAGAIAEAPDQAMAILASARDLIEASFDVVGMARGSREPQDILARWYVSREAPRLAADIRDSARRLQREFRGEIENL